MVGLRATLRKLVLNEREGRRVPDTMCYAHGSYKDIQISTIICERGDAKVLT